jgi:hypothetical protein
MKIGFQPSQKAFPYPFSIAAGTKDVISIRDYHLDAIGGRGIIVVSAVLIDRDPIRGARKAQVIRSARLGDRHADRMLL